MYTSKHTYGKKSITPKAKKLHPFIDLTAMVNLSFLLMMFFMLQSFMKKPYSMDLRLPQQYNDPYGWSTGGCGGEWKTFTILLGANNKVVTYMGLVDFPVEKPKAFTSGSKALRNNIIAVNEYVKEHVNDPKKEGLFVIIKPSAACVFENLVETMDEMHINKVRGFVVDDRLNESEQKLLEK
ncbi:ExbD/TolR family protein [Flavobacterium terrigena]|uniref:Biopolymer transport protein ExbD/TolR n=1 Tax=Flavobacterium terrigena TaxID=402734 RepID=A0A1H6WVL2_9FLAO|nr:biopolymer transporter ExbD [Flavobacterium terrigena]SEJ19886.1 Biopolymer transport protein ExbD/TolR [Flavobacterium terrigena]